MTVKTRYDFDSSVIINDKPIHRLAVECDTCWQLIKTLRLHFPKLTCTLFRMCKCNMSILSPFKQIMRYITCYAISKFACNLNALNHFEMLIGHGSLEQWIIRNIKSVLYPFYPHSAFQRIWYMDHQLVSHHLYLFHALNGVLACSARTKSHCQTKAVDIFPIISSAVLPFPLLSSILM